MNKGVVVLNKYEEYYEDQLKKSNVLINAKYNATALQMKEINLALYNIQQGNYKKKEDGFYVEMTSKEIKNEINGSETYIYGEILRTTSEVMNVKVGIFGENEFEMVTLINKATYQDGVLTLRMPLEAEPYINVKEGFTLLPKHSTLYLKKTWSIRLFEILKAECYYPAYYKGEKSGVFKKVISIDELRVLLCLIDLKDVSVKKAMDKQAMNTKNGSGIDYSAVVEAAKEIKYKDWRDLNKRVLEPAIKEINSTPEAQLNVEYTPIKVGRAYGKVEFIMRTTDYYVYNNKKTEQKEDDDIIDAEFREVAPKRKTKKKNDKDNDEINKFAVMLEVAAIIAPVGLNPVADVEMICEVAKYDVEKIKKAAEYMGKQKNIENPPAYMRKCIEEEWYDNIPVPKKETKKKTKNRFNDFPQREYSSEEIAEMEKKLLRQTRMTTNEDDDIPKW